MLSNLIIGQYYPAKSPVHSLDARIKLVCLAAYMILIFAVGKWLSYAVIAVFTAAAIVISKVPAKAVFKALRPVLWILVITAVINIFVMPGRPVAEFLGLRITYEGIISAALISVRLILIVTAASLLTLTTPPLSLTDGLERLLRPLEKIKLPARDIAMMMTIAIRFIPTLGEELQKIKKAQSSRGADFETGNIAKRAKAMLPLFVPLFMNAFRRADALAEAMDARCYGRGGGTRLYEPKITAADISAVIIFIAAAGLVLAAEFVIEI